MEQHACRQQRTGRDPRNLQFAPDGEPQRSKVRIKTILCSRYLRLAAVLAPAVALCIPTARAALVYSNNFNGAPGTTYPEWSSSVIAYTNNIRPPGSGTLPA